MKLKTYEAVPTTGTAFGVCHTKLPATAILLSFGLTAEPPVNITSLISCP